MTTRSPLTSARVMSSFGWAETTDSGLPSGSESLSSTRTETVVPGRTVTSSRVATGLRAPSRAALMPIRTVPVARAPRASITAYWNSSVPLE